MSSKELSRMFCIQFYLKHPVTWEELVKSSREIGKEKVGTKEISGGNGHPQGEGDNRPVVCLQDFVATPRFREQHLQVYYS